MEYTSIRLSFTVQDIQNTQILSFESNTKISLQGQEKWIETTRHMAKPITIISMGKSLSRNI